MQAAKLRAHTRLAGALPRIGDIAGAKQALQDCYTLMPDFSRQFLAATHPFRNPAPLGLLLDSLRRAGWNGGEGALFQQAGAAREFFHIRPQIIFQQH